MKINLVRNELLISYREERLKNVSDILLTKISQINLFKSLQFSREYGWIFLDGTSVQLTIDCSRNFLTEVEVGEFCQSVFTFLCQNREELNESGLLFDLGSDEFSNFCRSISAINLTCNQLRQFTCASQILPSCTVLLLGQNPLSILEVVWREHFPNLEVVSFAQTAVKRYDKSIRELSGANTLKLLDIAFCHES